jgi:hypothetical protein
MTTVYERLSQDDARDDGRDDACDDSPLGPSRS